MTKYKLGDIAPIKQGVGPDAYPCWLLNLDMVESNTGRIIEYLYVQSDEIGSSTVAFDTNNVLYSKLRPYLNKVVLPDRSGYATSEMLPLMPDNKIITREYLTYFLRSPRFVGYINEKTSGAKMPRANTSDLKAVEIDCPSLERQKTIVGIFDRLTYIIDLYQRQLRTLDNLIKARFVELFGDPVTNNMNWEMRRFDSLCENLDGKRRPITSIDRVTGPYPYYGASGIVDYVADYIFDENLLLVSEDGANLLARSTPIAFSVSGKVWVNNHAHVLRFSDFSLQKYIENFFSMISIEDYITGSTQPKLNQAKLNAMQIPIPTKGRMKDFLSIISQIDKSKVVVQGALDEARLLFDSLMQKYFG